MTKGNWLGPANPANDTGKPFDVGDLIALAFVVGVGVGVGCFLWRNSTETPSWLARNFVWTGLIALAVVLAAGRTLMFMSRLESQSRD